MSDPDITEIKDSNHNEIRESEEPNFEIQSFGENNSDKTFYVIKR